MERKDKLSTIRSVAENTANLVVGCSGCTSCCENALVYIFDEEVEIMKESGVPLTNICGVHFILRDKGGGCPMIDHVKSTCSIYEERPICCRLFPLDLFNRNGKAEWGYYNFCPKERQDAGRLCSDTGHLNMGLVLQALHMLEETFGESRIKYLKNEDLVSKKHELFDTFKYDFEILGDLAFDN